MSHERITSRDGEDEAQRYGTPPCECGACLECRAWRAFRRGELSADDLDRPTHEEIEVMVARIEDHRAAMERLAALIREMTEGCPRAAGEEA